MDQGLTEDLVETLRSAGRRLTGFKRRQFLAEMAVKYCRGSARLAETVFGWGRAAVNTGLNERRTGIRCVDNFQARGRRKTEEQTPELAEEVQRIVEPAAQADPKFQTPFAFTRITARAVRDQLLEQPQWAGKIPSRQTVGEILNRLGYRLRRVLKTRPEKNFPKPTPFSPTSSSVVRRLAQTPRR
jgi:hypothetical protein